MHTLENPLITLHDARGRVVFAQPLLHHDPSQVLFTKAWDWVPPPLVGEGRKVQSEWLYEFLLDPHPIRPLTVLRMPQFNMSSHEATALRCNRRA